MIRLLVSTNLAVYTMSLDADSMTSVIVVTCIRTCLHELISVLSSTSDVEGCVP